ncbi:MAG TPA: phenylacetate--CoA ligase family protein [Verrucomicrobiae bacterium]|nr:phenylacetate--CoA ligase family protein [Verrucomicrobiae bacterium]
MKTNPHPAGFAEALATFQEAATRVPAYRDFLVKNSIDPEKVTTPEDFSVVPPVTKENYLKAYPLPDLLKDGDVTTGHVVSMSSGSSGTPSFWFRNDIATRQSVELNNTLFRTSYKSHEEKTLVIIAYAMGTWIAGTYMFTGILKLAEEDHHISLVTPGINKGEIIHILKNLAPHFERTVIAGYPPFVKDVLDDAEEAGAPLTTLNVSLLFAGENYSEMWRDYVLKKIGKQNDITASVGIYGTADAGIMGFENPFSIFARRKIVENEALMKSLFPQATLLPTLVGYRPDMRYFETNKNYLLFTADNAMPLIRYKINDEGRLITGEELTAALAESDIEIPADLIQAHGYDQYLALYGRSDVSTTFYALDIFPENIKYGLESHELQERITGKFVLRSEYDRKQNQTLHLYVELRRDKKQSESLAFEIQEAVMGSLRKYNSEYNKLYSEMGAKARPRIHLLAYGAPEFEIKIKHRWTSKQ